MGIVLSSLLAIDGRVDTGSGRDWAVREKDLAWIHGSRFTFGTSEVAT
jgi:hypothetical protein